MLQAFINANMKLSRSVEEVILKAPGIPLIDDFMTGIQPGHAVADVGGGKHPCLAGRPRPALYEGLDIDAEELRLAPPGTYTATHEVDITAPPPNLRGRYDRIICRSTLEHVPDGRAAIEGLSALLKEGGECYIKVPCRHAAFAFLNRKLPEAVKRRLLYAIFPHKKETSGFPALYEGCTISDMLGNAQRAGLLPAAGPQKVFWSSYFSFFFPAYLAWRGFSAAQYLLIPDYCESFELVLRKKGSE